MSDQPSQPSEVTEHRLRERTKPAAKFGIAVGILQICLLITGFILANSDDDPIRGSDLDGLAVGLFFGCSAVLAITSIVLGSQKNRVGLGILSAILTPIGFLFILFAESGAAASSERERLS